ncbi:MAG TPA: OmpA family protein, partial [Geminicoccaceae bacterium]|nr:OmpA family protein [Geminicoccaceae bacterium]
SQAQASRRGDQLRTEDAEIARLEGLIENAHSERATQATALRDATAAGERLRQQLAAAERQLTARQAEMEQLSTRLLSTGAERDQLRAAAGQVDELRRQLAAAQTELGKSQALAAQRAGELSAKAAEVARLSQLVETASTERATQEAKVRKASADATGLQQQLAEAKAQLSDRERLAAGRADQLASGQAEIARLNQLLDTARAEQAKQETAAREASADAARLQQQLAAAEHQLADAHVDSLRELKQAQNGEILRLLAVLGAAEAQLRGKEQTVRDLGAKVAMTAEMTQLSEFRSQFFSRLHAVLEQREDVQIVGDSFVLPAEILFESGSAELGPSGKAQLHKVAQALRDIGSQIPPDLDWVLRIDGHTDKLPIKTAQFDSNWDLAAARAISVVKFLLSDGIRPEWLSANAFGQFHPLDSADDASAFRRNRRIELRLTQR